MRFFLIVASSLTFLGCTAGMPEASVLTSPPKLEKALFDKSILEGEYIQKGAPQMFLWPINRFDEESGGLTPLSHSEKAAIRGEIILYSETLEYFSKIVESLEVKLFKKYQSEIVPLEKTFTANKCYSYCDPDMDKECDPENATILEIKEGAWIQSDDPVINANIAVCMDNQKSRQDLKGHWDNERELKVIPLRKKAEAASQSLIHSIGVRNFFWKLTKFQMSYVNEDIEIKILYGGVEYSNSGGAQYPVDNIQLDKVDGFLSFEISAIDLENENKVFGTIKFDLEITSVESGLNIGGDIRLSYIDGKPERVGRFSSNGKIVRY